VKICEILPKCVKFACNYFRNSSASEVLRPQILYRDSRPPDVLWLHPSQISFRRLCHILLLLEQFLMKFCYKVTGAWFFGTRCKDFRSVRWYISYRRLLNNKGSRFMIDIESRKTQTNVNEQTHPR